MARPPGSKNKATLDREALQKAKGPLTAGPQGDPDPEALAQIDEANRVPDGAQIVGEEPEQPELATSPAATADLQAQILQAIANPAIANKMLEVASSTPEGRALLNLSPGQGTPSGEGVVNYRRRDQRVLGGVEVEHAPDFVRLPPSQIIPYLRADGTPTYYAEPLVEPKILNVPAKNADGTPLVNEEGNQVVEPKTVEVIMDPGAAKDAQGRPMKSPQYRLWLDSTLNGGRLEGDAVTTPGAGLTTLDGGPVVQLTGDGQPVTMGPGTQIE